MFLTNAFRDLEKRYFFLDKNLLERIPCSSLMLHIFLNSEPFSIKIDVKEGKIDVKKGKIDVKKGKKVKLIIRKY